MALPTRLFEESVTEFAKKSQITEPVIVSAGYFWPGVYRPARRPKNSVKTIMYMIGCKTAQKTPRNVCL